MAIYSANTVKWAVMCSCDTWLIQWLWPSMVGLCAVTWTTSCWVWPLRFSSPEWAAATSSSTRSVSAGVDHKVHLHPCGMRYFHFTLLVHRSYCRVTDRMGQFSWNRSHSKILKILVSRIVRVEIQVYSLGNMDNSLFWYFNHLKCFQMVW